MTHEQLTDLFNASTTAIRYRSPSGEERIGELDLGPPVRIYHRELKTGVGLVHRDWEDVMLTEEQIERLRLDSPPGNGRPDIILDTL